MSDQDEAFDLAIIGAGVIGCAIASAAARLGRSVLLLERDVRECGALGVGVGVAEAVERQGQWQRVLKEHTRRNQHYVWSTL